MSFLEQHLEEFVRPNLGHIPNIDPTIQGPNLWTPKMITCLEAVWKQAKRRANGRKILLAGRDTWEFEILARIEGVPTDFRPDISTSVAVTGLTYFPNGGGYDFDRKGKPHPLIKEDYSEHYLLDSGYKGTIPKSLGVKNWDMVRLSLGSLVSASRDKQQEVLDQHQVFPLAYRGTRNKLGQIVSSNKQSPVYNLVSSLEGSPKYWTSGTHNLDKTQIVQKLALDKQYMEYPSKTCPAGRYSTRFEKAAMITQLIVQSLRFTKPRTWIDMKVSHVFQDTNGKKFCYKVFGD